MGGTHFHTRTSRVRDKCPSGSSCLRVFSFVRKSLNCFFLLHKFHLIPPRLGVHPRCSPCPGAAWPAPRGLPTPSSDRQLLPADCSKAASLAPLRPCGQRRPKRRLACLHGGPLPSCDSPWTPPLKGSVASFGPLSLSEICILSFRHPPPPALQFYGS